MEVSSSKKLVLTGNNSNDDFLQNNTVLEDGGIQIDDVLMEEGVCTRRPSDVRCSSASQDEKPNIAIHFQHTIPDEQPDEHSEHLLPDSGSSSLSDTKKVSVDHTDCAKKTLPNKHTIGPRQTTKADMISGDIAISDTESNSSCDRECNSDEFEDGDKHSKARQNSIIVEADGKCTSDDAVDRQSECTDTSKGTGGSEDDMGTPRRNHAVGEEQKQDVSHDEFSTMGQYNVHSRSGKNVKLVKVGKAVTGAKRSKKAKTVGDGMVMTDKPLKVGVMFKIQIEPNEDDRGRNITIGATSKSPLSIEYPSNMLDFKDDVNIIWSDKNVYVGGKFLRNIEMDLQECTVGDTIGVEKTVNDLILYVNDKKVDRIALRDRGWGNQELYGVVDMFGRGTCVSICAENSYKEKYDGYFKAKNPFPVDKDYKEKEVRSVMTQVRKVVIALKQCKNDVKDYPLKTPKIIETFILKPHKHFKDDALRQIGDHLAKLGAATDLATISFILLKRKMKIQATANTCKISRLLRKKVIETCHVYARVSRKLSNRFGQTDLFGFLVDKLIDGISRSDDLREGMLLILYHCSKYKENRSVFLGIEAFQTLKKSVNHSNSGWSALLTLTLTNVMPKDEQQDFCVPKEVTDCLHTLLKNADSGKNPYASDTVSVEIVRGLGVLASNKYNTANIVRKGTVKLLLSLIKTGKQAEKDCAATTLLVLVRNKSECSAELAMGDYYKQLKKIVRRKDVDTCPTYIYTAQKALSDIKPQEEKATTKRKTGISNSEEQSCECKGIAEKLKRELNMPDKLFNAKFDKCYCHVCHGDDQYYERGEPPALYALPIGWYRFGIKVHPRVDVLNVYKKWHRAFHGTTKNAVKSILVSGDLLQPGDTTMQGNKLSERSGHLNTGTGGVIDFDTKQVFLSPSIRYSAEDHYATAESFSIDGVIHKARVVFQVYILPESYNI